MKPFALLIKPASSDCNLACTYCFYRGRHQLLKGGECPPRMSDEVLTRLISSYLKTEQPVHTFMWQGGEPTLMGIEFYQRVNDLQVRFASPNASIVNAIQTNGVLVDSKFAEHFAQYHYLCGVSLDGPEYLHDRGRIYPSGRGSHFQVMKSIEILKRYQVDFNALVLVSQNNVRHPNEVYDFITDTGFLYQQYIPCIEFDASGKPLPCSLDGPGWGEFLCCLFDRWCENGVGKICIQLFDVIMQRLLEGTQGLCVFGSRCDNYLVVEYNGDIYPCDFYVYPEWELGSIKAQLWNDMLESNKYMNFAARKSDLNSNCKSCQYVFFCGGGCPRERPRGALNSALCEGWKMFFEHALPRFSVMAERIRHKLISEGVVSVKQT